MKASEAAAVLRLPPLRPYQRDLVNSRKRELVTVSSTQIGKSFACACWLLAFAWEHPGSRCWWCAPVYYLAETIGYQTLRDIATRAGIVRKALDGKLKLLLVNGSLIECRSWDNPDNLQGPNVHAMVIDEAGLLTARARSILSTRRSSTQGPVRYIGNPTHNRSQFYRLVRQANSAEGRRGHFEFMKWTWRDYAAFLQGKARDEYVDFIEHERKTLPHREFERLYEAVFTDVAEQALNLRPLCVDGGSEQEPVYLPFELEPQPGARYAAGIDLAQTVDYTVVSVVRVIPAPAKLVAMHRFHRVPWKVAVKRSAAVCEKYNNCPAWVDATGLGSPVVEMMQETMGVWPVKFTGGRMGDVKTGLVQSLQVAVENQGFTMPWIEVAVDEADQFEADVLPSGRLKYGAAEGEHDDVVISLALAVHGMDRVDIGMVA